MPEFQEPVVSRTESASSIHGESKNWMGVFGKSESTTGGHGVLGQAHGTGVAGVSETWVGVYGESNGSTNGPAALWGEGKNGAFGVKGHARSEDAAGVGGFHLADTGDGGPGVLGQSIRGNGVVGRSDRAAGVFGESSSPTGWAGFFRGRVWVDQSVTAHDVVIAGADCAEDFEVPESAELEPGTVMVIRENGLLVKSGRAYDRCVAGVISGGGLYRPGIVLGRRGSSRTSTPIALAGRVYCKVDADQGAVEVGDLLTTSPTPGHAMKASDIGRAFGAVLGKALTSLRRGHGLVPVLVALQ